MNTLYYENEKHVFSFDVVENLFAEKMTEKVIVISKSIETENLSKDAVIFESLESALKSIVDEIAEQKTKTSLEIASKNIADNGFTFQSFVNNRIIDGFKGFIKKDNESDITYYLTIEKRPLKVNFLAKDKETEIDIFGDNEIKRNIAEMIKDLYNIVCSVSGAISGKEFERHLKEFYGENENYKINSRRIHALKGSFSLSHSVKYKTVDGEQKMIEKIEYRNKDNNKAEFCSILFANDTILETIVKKLEKKAKK